MTALAVMSLLAACGGVGKASAKPADGAENWFDAALNGQNDAVRARTCKEGRTAMWALPLAEFLLDPSGGFLALAEAIMPADTFTYQEISNHDGRAVVKVSSPSNFLIPGSSFDFWMVKEDGEWHWCGGEES